MEQSYFDFPLNEPGQKQALLTCRSFNLLSSKHQIGNHGRFLLFFDVSDSAAELRINLAPNLFKFFMMISIRGKE
jgi:hypothetical protein